MSVPARAWMVRSGYLENPEEVWNKGAVVVGWYWMGDLTNLTTREAVRERFAAEDPDGSSAQRIIVNASQLYRFAHEIQPGDYVLTYLKGSRGLVLHNRHPVSSVGGVRVSWVSQDGAQHLVLSPLSVLLAELDYEGFRPIL